MAAPPLITLRGARIGFGGPALFDGLDLNVGRGERASLVGRNGCGKTTLMRVLTGEIELDAGERYVEPGLDIAYLPQDPEFDPDQTARAHVATSGQPDHRVEAALATLKVEGDRPIGELSGGERRRVALARAFAGTPDVLMLDEPTNHLDLAAIEWLEQTLLRFPGAVLTVSHDRTFLARVTNRILWLDQRRLRHTSRGFGHFETWSEEVAVAEEKAARRLDDKIAQETRWMLKGITARRKRNQGRLRRLTEMRITRAALLGSSAAARMKAEESEIKSRLVIEAKGISKSFTTPDGGERPIVRDFSTRILRGDRIGLIGPNGSGKTTLLKLLSGEIEPDGGRIRIAKQLKHASFDQNREALNRKLSLRKTLCPGGGDQVWVRGKPRHVRAYLKDFLFDPKAADSTVGSLSGGERNRLMLAKILASPCDLLMLDEPTNDLDMDTLDLLQDLLAEFGGTLLLVSHDRDFLDRTVTSTIVMEGDGGAREYAGGYSDYLSQRQDSGPKPRAAAPPRREAKPRPARTRKTLSYKDQRELDGLPERLAILEAEILTLEAALADADLYQRDPAAFEAATRRLEAANGEHDAAEERWLELEARREELEMRRAE